MKLLRSIFCCSFALCSAASLAADPLQFDCRRTERDYTEDYVLVIVPASKTQAKPRIYLDGRDLDQSDAGGHQSVKNVVITNTSILISIEAHFDPEVTNGVSYPAGMVSTQIVLNRATGQLKKIETISGGILGATVGEGTKSYEEQCASSKLN